jgi:hypothetical protein
MAKQRAVKAKVELHPKYKVPRRPMISTRRPQPGMLGKGWTSGGQARHRSPFSLDTAVGL